MTLLLLPSLFRASRRGQMAVMMVIGILLFLLLMFPVMNLFVQNEAKWSVKEKKATEAFHLAEAGVDRARWKLLENTDMWNITSTGTISGYHFDKTYTTEDGGTYAINITSDPADGDRRIVESVGRDKTGAQTRRIRAVLINDSAADFSVWSGVQIENTGNAHIEWGPVYSGNSINATGMTYPRYFSAGHVSPQDGGSSSASTDGVYWWSYYAIPPTPNVKFSVYLASAVDSGNAPNGCGNGNSSTYYRVGNATFKGCNDTSGKTYYITGNVDFVPGSGGNFIVGNVLSLGEVTVQGNGGGNGSYNANIPPMAWKEYGANWAHYLTFDPAGSGSPATPATYAAAVASNYIATNKTYPLTEVIVHGFLYAGKEHELTGGGSGVVHGVLMVGKEVEMQTSSFKVYYDDGVATDILLQGVNIRLYSWYEVPPVWPSGL